MPARFRGPGRVKAGQVVALAVALVLAVTTATVILNRTETSAQAETSPTAGITFPLHTSGANIVDASGKTVKLNMVNWYGADSPDYVVGGLQSQPISEIINKIVSMGFNGVRLPWSNQMWESNPTVASKYVTANPSFAGKPARTVFEDVVHDLANAGLMVVLDNHTSNAEWCCGNSDGNTLWYNSSYPQSAWLSDWESVTREFKNVPQVIGADLRNEPRGSAAWGGSNSAYDWHAAAQTGGNAVLGVDPHWLIFVEGVNYSLDLSGVSSLPVKLNTANQLVYEAHDYPWDFSGDTTYDSFASKIQSQWGYLAGKVPLWIGEFGTCNTGSGCVSGTSANGAWWTFITRYLKYHDVNWSYWPVNGTESDGLSGQGRTFGATETYGILNTSWDGAALPAMLSGLQADQPACPSSPLANGTYYIKNRGSGDVIDIPKNSTTEGQALEQWPSNDKANQQWKLTQLGCGVYEITSAMDGQAMDVNGQSTSAGGSIDQWPYSGGGNQQFIITKNSSGYYTITNLNSMDLVEVPGSSNTAGTLLDQWPSNSGNNQQWSFIGT
ncbi:MAG: cellulase family glycosylhydrolase [Nocardiopsaceae bacterium]|nr:cellulase family glycosylhydrolase [Nocardiopsaceae bacterium]